MYIYIYIYINTKKKQLFIHNKYFAVLYRSFVDEASVKDSEIFIMNNYYE